MTSINNIQNEDSSPIDIPALPPKKSPSAAEIARSPWLHSAGSVTDLFSWGKETASSSRSNSPNNDDDDNKTDNQPLLDDSSSPNPAANSSPSLSHFQNPKMPKTRHPSSTSAPSPSPWLTHDIKIALLSNITTSFNVVSISLTLKIMGQDSSPWAAEMSEAAKAATSSALIAGMVCGQLLFGSLGDIIGLDTAMAATITTQLIGSLGSALSFEVPGTISIFTVLTIWRFILGVGCGGVYPLAANMASSSTKNAKDRGQSVALVFSMQGENKPRSDVLLPTPPPFLTNSHMSQASAISLLPYCACSWGQFSVQTTP